MQSATRWLALADVALGQTPMINCSQCGAIKRETNHWLLVWTERKTRLCIAPFDDDPAMLREPTVQKICGSNCLHAAVEQHAEMVRNSQ